MERLRNWFTIPLAIALVGVAMAIPRCAQAERHEFRGRDVHHFEHRDYEHWRRGNWHEGWHAGRHGRWWSAGGAWYYYDRPVYPYPPVVSETIFVEPQPVYPQPVYPAPVYTPAPVIVAPPPQIVVPAPQPGPAPQQFWYYCDDPAGYYPYVTSCTTSYRAIPVPTANQPPQAGSPLPDAPKGAAPRAP